MRTLKPWAYITLRGVWGGLILGEGGGGVHISGIGKKVSEGRDKTS